MLHLNALNYELAVVELTAVVATVIFLLDLIQIRFGVHPLQSFFEGGLFLARARLLLEVESAPELIVQFRLDHWVQFQVQLEASAHVLRHEEEVTPQILGDFLAYVKPESVRFWILLPAVRVLSLEKWLEKVLLVHFWHANSVVTHGNNEFVLVFCVDRNGYLFTIKRELQSILHKVYDYLLHSCFVNFYVRVGSQRIQKLNRNSAAFRLNLKDGQDWPDNILNQVAVFQHGLEFAQLQRVLVESLVDLTLQNFGRINDNT